MAGRKIAVSSIMMLALVLSFPALSMNRAEVPCNSWLGVAHAQVENFDALKVGPEVSERMSDPLEPLNRFIFTVNDRLYFWVLKPVAIVYKTIIPEPLRIGVDNAFYNFRFPIRFVNNVLQGKFQGAGSEVLSFVINSTLGVGGFFDPAQKEFHLKRYREDFGQTLGFYGMRPIIFICLPIVGPSSLRDGIGRIGDHFTHPLFWLTEYDVLEWFEASGMMAGENVNYTSLHLGEYEDFKRSALDPYVAMRSAHYQYRENLIRQ